MRIAPVTFNALRRGSFDDWLGRLTACLLRARGAHSARLFGALHYPIYALRRLRCACLLRARGAHSARLFGALHYPIYALRRLRCACLLRARGAHSARLFGALHSLKLTLTIWVMLACLPLIYCQASYATLPELPAASTKELPMVPEKSVSTFIPWQATEQPVMEPAEETKGKIKEKPRLVLNIIYPEKPRYDDGAPVVVVVPAGDGANGLGFDLHATQIGFVEIRFAFPGGGGRGLKSSGTPDYRGKDSQKALHDILLFAMGKTADFQNRTIQDLLPIKVSSTNVGMVGWSNGGNIALVTLAKYASDLDSLAWIAFYESPLGSLFFPPSLGGINDLVINKHYREGSAATGTCLIDFRKLAWDKDTMRHPGIHKKLREPELPGVLYFDDNDNKRWDEPTEFAFSYCLDKGLEKHIYAPEVTLALERLKVFGNNWDETVASLAESESYFQERDGSACIADVCEKYPKLLISIFGSQVDHLQRQSDHPHILLQYNSWLDNGAHWVRLNPEPIYLTQIANMNWHNFVYNKPNTAIDATEIIEHLEPDGPLEDFAFMNATIAELADRKRTNNLKSPLEAPLVNYSNGLVIPAVLKVGDKKPQTVTPTPKPEQK